MEDVKIWLRTHASKVLVIGTAALLALAGVSLASSLLSDGAQDAEDQAQALIAQYEDDLAAAQDALNTTHNQLLAGLPGVDMERAARDEAPGTAVLLSTTESSSSSHDVTQTQQLLDARYDFFDTDSRTLTEFIPEWMSATGSSQGVGPTYTIGDLNIDVTSVSGLDYGYVGLARMDPVVAEGTTTTKSEYVLFRYTTAQDGSVTSFEAYRLSTRSRDALLAQEAEAESTATPTPTSSPTPTPTETGD